MKKTCFTLLVIIFYSNAYGVTTTWSRNCITKTGNKAIFAPDQVRPGSYKTILKKGQSKNNIQKSIPGSSVIEMNKHNTDTIKNNAKKKKSNNKKKKKKDSYKKTDNVAWNAEFAIEKIHEALAVNRASQEVIRTPQQLIETKQQQRGNRQQKIKVLENLISKNPGYSNIDIKTMYEYHQNIYQTDNISKLIYENLEYLKVVVHTTQELKLPKNGFFNSILERFCRKESIGKIIIPEHRSTQSSNGNTINVDIGRILLS